MNLTFHGRTRESCRWVIWHYARNPFYSENKSVQEWVQDCRAWLDAKEEDEEFDRALEYKFGKIE